jgi:CHAT domain-containing protein
VAISDARRANIGFPFRPIPMSVHKKHCLHSSFMLAAASSTLIGAVLLICGPFASGAGSSSQSSENQSIVNLSPSGIERDISPGERQLFKIALSENQLLRLFVDKGDLSISLIISEETGQNRVARVSRGYGVLDVSMVARTTGTYQIEIHSLEAKDQRHYKIRVNPLGEATSGDVELDSAQQLLASASWLREQWTEGSLKQALESYDQAANIARRRNMRTAAVAMSEAGQTLFLLGQYRLGLKRFAMAADSAENAGDKLEQAGALSQAARLQSYLGSNDEAEAGLAHALKLIDTAGPEGSSPRGKQIRAEALSNLGEIGYSKGNLVRSKADFSNALDLFTEVGDRDGQARVHLFQAYIAGNIGQPEKAVDEISQATVLYEAVGDKAGKALCLTALGISHSVRREEERAMAMDREAAEIFRVIGDRPSEAITLNALGQAYEFLNDNQTALENYQKALNLLGENIEGDIGAVTIFKIARMQRLLGDLEEALKSYDQCLNLSRRAGKRRTEANALNDVALIYSSQGSREKTVGQYRKILAFYRRISDWRGEAIALNNLGDFLASLGDQKAALVLYQRALGLSELTEDKTILISSLCNLARASRDLGMLEDALDYVNRSIQIIEELRSDVATPEFRTSYFAGVHKQYDLLIDVLMRCESRWPNRGFAARALIASETGRARSLIDMRAEAGADIRQNVPPGLLERERELQGLLRSQAKYQMDLSTQKQDHAKSEEAARQIADLRSQYQQIESQVRDQNPRFLALQQAAPLSVEEIQAKLLDQDSILLEYALGDERSYLWVVSNTSFASFELPSRAVLEPAALEVYTLLTARQAAGKVDSAYQANIVSSDDSYFEKALELSRVLLGPSLSQLGSKRLLVVTEGVLQYIPFDALPVPEAPVGTRKDLPLLISTHEIVTLPSLSTLSAIRREKVKPRVGDKVVAVLADPVFDSNDDRVESHNSGRVMAAAFDDTYRLRDVASPAIDGAPMRLAHAAEEAEAILAVAPHGSAMLVQGFEATRDTAMTSLIGDYRIVHFAAHGFVNKDHPELSGIVLSQIDRSGKGINGFVPVRDIYNLNLSADLVVLSACDTALGKDIKGEGLVGLTHGFLASGSNSVVASLWKVDDRATSVLMANFYKSMLQDGLPPAAALRSAKEQVRRQKGWQEPYFWAGFVLQGEYNQRIAVHRESSYRPALAITFIGALILLGAILVKGHRRRIERPAA